MTIKKLGKYLSITVLGILIMGSTAYAQINPTVRRGDSGNNVLAVQQLLATEPLLYPSQLVTGYFGPLTESAVEQFQLQYNMTVDGIVGPRTALMMNAALRSSTGLDIRVPIMSAVVSSLSNDSATINVHTINPARTYVYYDTKPITGGDSTDSFALPTVSGTLVMDPKLVTDHSITLSNLSPNTTYYAVVLSQDSSGNVSAQYIEPFTVQ